MGRRFFATGPLPPEGVLPLSSGDVRHIRDVLRSRAGDVLEIAAEEGVFEVRLTEVGVELAGVRMASVAGVPDLPAVTLAQGLAKGDKMDTVVRQATELGVARIVPFVAERSVVRLDPARAASRIERWRRVAEGAAKQARRADVPEVTGPVPVEELAGLLRPGRVLVCWEDAHDAAGICAALAQADVPPDAPVAVVVGPEGGLTADEVASLVDAGAIPVSLGPTVLRTETAGVVAAALAIAALGGLGERHG